MLDKFVDLPVAWRRLRLFLNAKNMTQDSTPDYIALMQKMADVVSHEIRNPLNNILLSTAQFKLDMPPDKEDTAFYIDIIERNCDRIRVVLTDIMSVIHHQGLRPDVFDITELVKEVLEEKSERFELRKIKCIASLNEVVVTRFDRALMKPVLDHLLENALDAISGGGTVHIDLREEDSAIKLQVRDSGEGIDSGVLPHIFAPFFTTRERHKGLGLALVKNVMDAHLGKIEVATGAGGSCFTLCLPRQLE